MRTKNILLILCLVIVMLQYIGFASAFEFDNTLTYGKNDKGVDGMKVVIHNAFNLFGEDLGTVELKSHSSPTQIKKVDYGKEEVVMYYDFSGWQEYKNGLGTVIFTDQKTGEEIERDYEFVYWAEQERDLIQYVDCYTDSNGHEQCDKEVIGSETYYDWMPYNSKDIPSENIRIGLKIYVEKDDFIDGVWTIAGKKITRHASWSAGLNTNLVSYYELTNVSDPVSSHDLTVLEGTPVLNTTNCLIGGCYWSSTDNHYQLPDDSDFDFAGTSEGTINLWVYKPAVVGTQGILDKYAGGGQGYYWQFNGDATYSDYLGDAVSSSSISSGSWEMLTYTLNSTLGCVWINGVIDACKTRENTVASASNIGFGCSDTGTEDFTGQFDELGIWSSELSSAQITDLYNGGAGITYDSNPTSPPTINLNNPANDTTQNNPTFNLNGTAWDNSALANESLIIDDVYIETNSSVINNTITNFVYTFTSADTKIWKIEACDDEGSCTNSSERYITYANGINITINSPVEAYNSSSATINPICTPSDDTAVINSSLIIDSAYNQTNSTGLNNTAITFSVDLGDGDHTWNCEVCDAYACLNGTARNLTIDTTDPIVNDAQNITDLVTFSLPVNSTWNYTVNDLHIDDCYYNTSDDASINIITCNSSINTTWATEGNKTIQYFANDTFGNEASKLAYVYVYDLNYTQSDDLDPVGEGTNVTYTLNISLTDLPTTTATLRLNNTYYTADTTTTTTNYKIFTKVITIPDGYGNTTGYPQPWDWNYTINGVTTNASTTAQTTTVYSLAIDNCTAYGEVILNLTLNDEESHEEVNGTLGSDIEIDLMLTAVDNSSLTWTYNKTWTNESNVAVCIPPNILNNSQYYIDFDIGFDSTDRVWEFFFLDDGVLNSTKKFDAQTNYTIDLMDLASADSTSFLFNYFDQDGLPVDDIIVHTFRKYIGEGLFREVERSKADENGDTIVHLVEEDVIYYFLITQYGSPLYTSSTYTALCQATPCTIQLEAGGDGAEFSTDWDLISGGSYQISDDADTRIVTLNYTLNSSATMNLSIYKYDSDGDVSLVTSNSSSEAEDTIIATVPWSAGNVSFFASLYQNDEFINSQWVDFESKPQDRFGITLSLFLGALIILTFGLISVTEGVGTLAMVILGVAVSGFLGLINTSLSTGINILVYLILAGGILLFKLTRRRG